MATTDSTVVAKLIEVLHDSAKGFEDIGTKLQDTQVKSFFVNEARTRRSFASELEGAVSGNSRPREDEGTAAGALHRAWGDLKAKLGGGDHTLLETAEQGEDVAKRAYEVALKDTNLPAAVRSVIERQQAHVQQSHDTVKAFRDQRAT